MRVAHALDPDAYKTELLIRFRYKTSEEGNSRKVKVTKTPIIYREETKRGLDVKLILC